MMTHDIVVVGGGPAGCALAIALKRAQPGLHVALLERSDYKGPRVGETLPPQCRVLFERLGIWEAFAAEDHLQAFGAKSAWGESAVASQEFMTSVQRNGWHLDRNRFDVFMARMATENGVEFHSEVEIREIKRQAGGGWRIASENSAWTCTVIADASGRSASVSRLAGAEVLRFDRLTGTMAVFDSPSILDRDTLVESVPEGWWYSALLPGRKMAAAFFTDAPQARSLLVNTREGWLRLLNQAPISAQRFLQFSLEQDLSLKSWPAQSQRLNHAIGKDWIAVGDAAAAYDPLSSQGIFFALRSALMAAFAVLDLLAGGSIAEAAIAKYQGHELEQYNGYWETRRDFYQMEQRWPEQAFWRSRHGNIKLAPMTHLQLERQDGSRPRFFSSNDLQAMHRMHPNGAPAHVWLQTLRALRPDLLPGHALEGLQCLVEDGHALILNTSTPAV